MISLVCLSPLSVGSTHHWQHRHGQRTYSALLREDRHTCCRKLVLPQTHSTPHPHPIGISPTLLSSKTSNCTNWNIMPRCLCGDIIESFCNNKRTERLSDRRWSKRHGHSFTYRATPWRRAVETRKYENHCQFIFYIFYFVYSTNTPYASLHKLRIHR